MKNLTRFLCELKIHIHSSRESATKL
jgi:hypothetical protein